jgi:pSer/pThr/pTyr-binding forkhead associated (FHA) protein
MQKGPNPGKIFELTQEEITIGRDISNRIVINDAEISRRHTRLSVQMGGYVVEDLGSTNGTFVDGQRLMGPHLLRPGQTIMLGEKISLAYEALGFDPNATLASSPQAAPPGPRETFRVEPDYNPAPVQPAQSYTPPAQQPEWVPPAPAYAPQGGTFSGQVPPGPYGEAETFDSEDLDEPRSRTRTMVFAGCGVLVVMACCLVVSVFAFDYLNLYCQAPFDSLSGILWSCTP